MTFLIIVLRIIHIFAGVLWVNAAFYNLMFVRPAVRATGAEGQRVNRYLIQQTCLTSYVVGVATLNLLAGLALYNIISRFRAASSRVAMACL